MSYEFIKKDRRYIRYRKLMEAENSAPKYQMELEDIHKARKSRYIDTGINVKKIINASLHDSVSRSRCVEIYNQMYKESYLLKNFLNTMSDYIMSEYSNNLGSSKYQKDSAINSILARGWSRLSDLEIACSTANKIIDDVDKTSWSFKSVLAGLEIATKGEITL